MSIVLYYIPILLCAVTPFFKELSDSRRWFICIGIYLCLFYCFGYMTGSDWKAYEDIYNNGIDFNRLFYGYSKEPGYYVYMLLFRVLGVGFWPFFIFTKTVIFLVIYKTIFDFCKESGYVALMYFLPLSGMYLLIDNPMRNCIAIAIFIVAVRFVIEHQFWKFLLCMLLAASFHFSALIIILFYPLLNHNIKTWVYVFLFVVINIFFIDRDFLIGILISLLGKTPFVQDKVVTYLLMDSVFAQGKLFSFGMIWQTGLFVLMLCYRERIVERIGGAKGLFVFNSVMVYMLLLRFAMTIRMFVRFQLYFSVFVARAVGLLLISFEYKSRLAYWSILCLVSLYMCTDKITGSARYVPYSNYIVYSIKGENPSYSTRYYYNIKHSPYTVDDDYAH